MPNDDDDDEAATTDGRVRREYVREAIASKFMLWYLFIFLVATTRGTSSRVVSRTEIED